MTRLAKIKTKKEMKTIPKDWPRSMNFLFGRIVKVHEYEKNKFTTYSKKRPNDRHTLFRKEIKWFL